MSSAKVAITSTESSITRRSASNALASNRDYVVHLTRHPVHCRRHAAVNVKHRGGALTLEDERTRPPWLSDELPLFSSRWFTTPDGHRMHYVDEGSGPVIVFLHGNPSWSFEFRHLIRELRHDFRCIAVDHVGFGLSSRSKRKEDHSPQAHAGRFSALMNYLDVKDATLYMSDWGGPVGLHFACHQPERVAGLAIANTWCWPVGSDLHFAFLQYVHAQPFGTVFDQAAQFLCEWRNAQGRGGQVSSHPGGDGPLPQRAASWRPARQRGVARPHRRGQLMAAFYLGR